MQKIDDPAKFQNFSELYQSETETNEIRRPSFVEDLDEDTHTIFGFCNLVLNSAEKLS